MSDLALFSIGTIVFFLGATGLALFGLDAFRLWGESSTEADDEHLDVATPEELTAPR
jgi:hypothetical protein